MSEWYVPSGYVRVPGDELVRVGDMRIVFNPDNWNETRWLTIDSPGIPARYYNLVIRRAGNQVTISY